MGLIQYRALNLLIPSMSILLILNVNILTAGLDSTSASSSRLIAVGKRSANRSAQAVVTISFKDNNLSSPALQGEVIQMETEEEGGYSRGVIISNILTKEVRLYEGGS